MQLYKAREKSKPGGCQGESVTRRASCFESCSRTSSAKATKTNWLLLTYYCQHGCGPCTCKANAGFTRKVKVNDNSENMSTKSVRNKGMFTDSVSY